MLFQKKIKQTSHSQFESTYPDARKRLCKHLGATREHVTNSDLKEQVEAQDPMGRLLPLYFLTPPSSFKRSNTPSSLNGKA